MKCVWRKIVESIPFAWTMSTHVLYVVLSHGLHLLRKGPKHADTYQDIGRLTLQHRERSKWLKAFVLLTKVPGYSLIYLFNSEESAKSNTVSVISNKLAIQFGCWIYYGYLTDTCRFGMSIRRIYYSPTAAFDLWIKCMANPDDALGIGGKSEMLKHSVAFIWTEQSNCISWRGCYTT